jgi:chromosome partitioning protein
LKDFQSYGGRPKTLDATNKGFQAQTLDATGKGFQAQTGADTGPSTHAGTVKSSHNGAATGTVSQKQAGHEAGLSDRQIATASAAAKIPEGEFEAAFMLADLVLIPVAPSPLDLRAAVQALDLWKEAKTFRNAEPVCILVPVRVDKRTTPGREIAGALKALGERVAPPLGSRTDFVMATAAGLPVAEYAPRSIAAAEVATLAKFIKRNL